MMKTILPIPLIENGATVIGYPPSASPSLTNFPVCDTEVQELAEKLWGKPPYPAGRSIGKGTIILDAGAADFLARNPKPPTKMDGESIYPDYATTATFRVDHGAPQLWHAVTGETRPLPQFERSEQTTSVPLSCAAHQGLFIVFPRDEEGTVETEGNFSEMSPVATLKGPWEVSFDPKLGGPEKVTFAKLDDWTKNAERGIKYYSGIATYRKTFQFAHEPGRKIYLDLGTVHDIARVTLNGKELGVVWCAPWQVEVSDVIRPGENTLEIEVANPWSNRLLGDQSAPDKDARTLKWETGLLGGKEHKAGRYRFTTYPGPGKLFPSGMIGPVRITAETK